MRAVEHVRNAVGQNVEEFEAVGLRSTTGINGRSAWAVRCLAFQVSLADSRASIRASFLALGLVVKNGRVSG